MRRTLPTLLAVLGGVVVVAAGCGSGGRLPGTVAAPVASGGGSTDRIHANPENAGVRIVIGAEDVTEQKVLGEIYARALEAAGYQVDTRLGLRDENVALHALTHGRIDGYPVSTGTALRSFFDVPTDKLPHDPQAAYDQVKADFQRSRPPIEALAPTPFEPPGEGDGEGASDDATFLVRQAFAEKAGADLAKTIELVNRGLGEDTIRKLEARVDAGGQTPAAVAAQYLRTSGYTA